MPNSNFNTQGNLYIKVTDQNGNTKQELNVNNLVVSTGRDYIAQRIASNNTPIMNYMAVGTGTNSPSVANTTLQAEIANSRVAMATTTTVSNTTTYAATFPAGTGTGSITEAGIFNDASAGLMLCRTAFAVVNKGELDSISITWNISAI